MSNGGSLSIPGRSANSKVPMDRAEISVDDQKFGDWETVWVQLRAQDGWHYFRFTAAEREASAGLFGSSTQFNVGKQCKISMGGVPVIDGLIEIRQVAYDAQRHHVELRGRSKSSLGARSSVWVKDSKFDGLDIKGAIEKAWKGYPVMVKTLGSVPSDVFDKLRSWPGEFIWDFSERVCRPAGVAIGVDHENNIILAKDYTGRSGSSLIEGQNIKHMQCVFDWTQRYQNYSFSTSHNETDGSHGQPITQQISAYKGEYPYVTHIHTPGEQNTKTKQELQNRNQFEARVREFSAVTATVVVVGWFRDGSTLWWPWDQVYVESPMCPLKETMMISAVTFTQEPTGGTQTTIDLANPLAMGGTAQHGALAGSPNDPQKTEPPAPNE